MMKVKDLVPYENNPRNNEGAIEAVKASMEQCETLDPIEIDENNVILAGHTRRLALMEMGVEEIEVLRYTGLTEEQKKKYRLLQNKTQEFASWKLDLLDLELEELDFQGFDFGFSTDDFQYDDGEGFEGSAEINPDDFSDESFAHECPKCGFKFND